MAENWYVMASYTLASSKGNNEGYVRSDNGQDDAGLTTNFDQPGLTDLLYYLPNHRRHTLKVSVTTDLPILQMGPQSGLQF